MARTIPIAHVLGGIGGGGGGGGGAGGFGFNKMCADGSLLATVLPVAGATFCPDALL